MKGLHLKLGLGIIVVFGLLITGYLCWTPLKIRYYTSKLKSDNRESSLKGYTGLLSLGHNGVKTLNLEIQRDAIEYLRLGLKYYFDSINESVDDKNNAAQLEKAVSQIRKQRLYLGIEHLVIQSILGTRSSGKIHNHYG